MSYQKFVDSLTKAEWAMLTGLAYIFAGADKPMAPTSPEFARYFGVGCVEDARAARKSLLAKGVINDHYEISDKVFLAWIWKEIFSVPRSQARRHKPCNSLDDSLCDP